MIEEGRGRKQPIWSTRALCRVVFLSFVFSLFSSSWHSSNLWRVTIHGTINGFTINRNQWILWTRLITLCFVRDKTCHIDNATLWVNWRNETAYLECTYSILSAWILFFKFVKIESIYDVWPNHGTDNGFTINRNQFILWTRLMTLCFVRDKTYHIDNATLWVNWKNETAYLKYVVLCQYGFCFQIRQIESIYEVWPNHGTVNDLTISRKQWILNIFNDFVLCARQNVRVQINWPF